MDLLPLCVRYPTRAISAKISSTIWEECMQIWTSLLQKYLGVPLHELGAAPKQFASLVDLLVSFMQETSSTQSRLQEPKARKLRQLVFLNSYRLLVELSDPPHALLHWSFLADIRRAFPHSKAGHTLIASAYSEHSQKINNSLSEVRNLMVASLESSKFDIFLTYDFNDRLLPLLKSIPAIGAYFVTGTGFVDATLSTYQKAAPPVQDRLIATIYFGVLGLTEPGKSSSSQLFDLLYTLKIPVTTATLAPEKGQHLISDLVTETPALSIISNRFSDIHASRAQAVLTTLQPLQRRQSIRPRNTYVRSTKDKESYASKRLKPLGHAYRLSSISRVQDLFPNLGSAFVLQLLDYYDDNIEAITSSLLDNSLPSFLQSLDRTAELDAEVSLSTKSGLFLAQSSHVQANSPGQVRERGEKTPTTYDSIYDRRNHYDYDDLDGLNISENQLHYGKRFQNDTADNLLLDDIDKHDMKAAILSALATFDADDDERDDTYDAEDVGGTIDKSVDLSSNDQLDDAEEILYLAWTAPGGYQLFSRDNATRKSIEREKLRKDSKMTDEAIEGWALMLAREPRRLRRLEKLFEDKIQGQPHPTIESTKWRASKNDEGVGEASESTQRTYSRGRGQGFSRDNPTKEGKLSGSTAGKATQLARQRKDAQKGSRANHNRRDQRAKKMARGGLPL